MEGESGAAETGERSELAGALSSWDESLSGKICVLLILQNCHRNILITVFFMCITPLRANKKECSMITSEMEILVLFFKLKTSSCTRSPCRESRLAVAATTKFHSTSVRSASVSFHPFLITKK